MKEYTIVLRRPLDIADCDPDIYVALARGDTVQEAVAAAQKEVWDADAEDIPDFTEFEIEPHHYTLIVGFHGHCQVALFGWQT